MVRAIGIVAADHQPASVRAHAAAQTLDERLPRRCLVHTGVERGEQFDLIDMAKHLLVLSATGQLRRPSRHQRITSRYDCGNSST